MPDLLDFQLDRAFGVDPVAGDALVHAADQPRIRQHRQMRVEHIADLVGGRARQRRRAGFQLAQLLGRDGDGLAEAGALVLDFTLLDAVLADRKLAAIADIGGANGDTGRNADPG